MNAYGRVKMLARIRMIAESFSGRRVSGKIVSDEMLENGIWQFGDGMGFTSIMSYPCCDAEDEAGEKVCAA